MDVENAGPREGVEVVEPGEFEILAGPSSRERDLLMAKLMVG